MLKHLCSCTTCYVPCNSRFLKVLAENYHKAANWSEPVMLNLDAVSPNAGISEGAIYGVTVTAAAIVAVLHIILIVLITIICWQRRKNKAVFLKVGMPLTLIRKSVLSFKLELSTWLLFCCPIKQCFCHVGH